MTTTNKLTVGWFSGGGDSAVAIKLMIDQIDRIIYIHIDDQHPDTMRFLRDCEQWFGKQIEVLQSPFRSVEAVCTYRGYINGPHGAQCTELLKKRVRKQWEYEQPLNTKLRYVWGMDYGEVDRANDFVERHPEQEHVFPLIDRQIAKIGVHQILQASGIKRPAMYDLGYNNNNCVGCVKGGMGYWNHIRVDFPEVFAARAAMERKVGHSCINGTYLDELDPDRGRHTPPIVPDCGILCEVMALGN